MIDDGYIQFLDSLASKDPVPGGGGASALAACIGVALTMMVGNLTVGKRKYADVENKVNELLEKSKKLETEFQALIKKDAEVFLPLSIAYSMPTNNEQEILNKKKTLQIALIPAAKVPLEIAEKALEALLIANEMSKIGSRIVISDSGVSAAMLKAALQGAKLNVLINTKLIEEGKQKQEILKRLDIAVSSGLEIADEIYRYVEGEL
jgi:formiminotetrahydrofolate cyclodeaminase